MTSRWSRPLFPQTRVDVVDSAMETKNPARCTMSMSATHTSGFNTGSDNQNKWLLFPLYSTCQHSPLKGGGVGRTAAGWGAGPGQPGKSLLCWSGTPSLGVHREAWPWKPSCPSQRGGSPGRWAAGPGSPIAPPWPLPGLLGEPGRAGRASFPAPRWPRARRLVPVAVTAGQAWRPERRPGGSVWDRPRGPSWA